MTWTKLKKRLFFFLLAYSALAVSTAQQSSEETLEAHERSSLRMDVKHLLVNDNDEDYDLKYDFLKADHNRDNHPFTKMNYVGRFVDPEEVADGEDVEIKYLYKNGEVKFKLESEQYANFLDPKTEQAKRKKIDYNLVKEVKKTIDGKKKDSYYLEGIKNTPSRDSLIIKGSWKFETTPNVARDNGTATLKLGVFSVDLDVDTFNEKGYTDPYTDNNTLPKDDQCEASSRRNYEGKLLGKIILQDRETNVAGYPSWATGYKSPNLLAQPATQSKGVPVTLHLSTPYDPAKAVVWIDYPMSHPDPAYKNITTANKQKYVDGDWKSYFECKINRTGLRLWTKDINKKRNMKRVSADNNGALSAGGDFIENRFWFRWKDLVASADKVSNGGRTVTLYAEFVYSADDYGSAEMLSSPQQIHVAVKEVHKDIESSSLVKLEKEDTAPEGMYPKDRSKFNPPQSNTFNTNVPIAKDVVTVNLLPVDIAVDSNRNGEVEFGIDQTSHHDFITAENDHETYKFWINNDKDIGNDDKADDVPTATLNYSDNEINGYRDLEDFARIQLRVGGLLDQLKSGEIQIALKFKDGTTVGTPAINLWLHLDEDGGRDYVENEDSAWKHVGPPGNPVLRPLRVTKDNGYVFNKSFWDGSNEEGYPEATESKPERYLLFEGAGIGKGELVIEFRKGDDILGEGGSCWLDLKDIKSMYEEYTMAGIYEKSWQQINQIAPIESTDFLTAEQKSLYDNYENPKLGEYSDIRSDTPNHEKDYILFVHGWRMTPYEKYTFAETAYKRLWHRGYRGRFGSFSWPTEWTSADPAFWSTNGIFWDPRNYDRSDRKAYLSGTALHKVLLRLNTAYPGRVRMFAHSMGNVVASQALRNEAITDDPKELVHTYAACQAATVAFAYDKTNPRTTTRNYIDSHPNVVKVVQAGRTFTAPESPEIPEIYGNYTFAGEGEYFGDIDNVVSNQIVNVHNWTDFALAGWMVNQWQKPDSDWGYSDVWGDSIDGSVWYRKRGIGNLQKHMLTPFHDTPEIFAHIAEAKSPALGASVEGINKTRNVVTHELNTMDAFGENQNFGGDSEDHSAQFLSTNMRRWEFWDRLLQDRLNFNIQTDYPKTNE